MEQLILELFLIFKQIYLNLQYTDWMFPELALT